MSCPQLSMESRDFTRTPDHVIASACKAILLPGVEMQRGELPFCRRTDLLYVFGHSCLCTFRSQAVQVPSHESTCPGGKAGDFPCLIATGRDHACRTIGPHGGRYTILLPKRPLRRQMHLAAESVVHRLDRLLLDSSQHRFNPQIAQNREGHRANRKAGPVPPWRSTPAVWSGSACATTTPR